MSLLDDFETLEQKQVNSIEYYLQKLIIQDMYPIVMNLDEFCREYFAFQNYGGVWDPDHDQDDPDHCFRARTNLMGSRVYIAGGIDESNVSKFASERIVLIGTLDDGFRKITTDDLLQYVELYTKQWPDSDYIYTLSQSIHYLFNKHINLNQYSILSPDLFNKHINLNQYSMLSPASYININEWKNHNTLI